MTYETSEIDAILPSRSVPRAIDWISAELSAGGVPTALGDAQIIVAHLLGLTRDEVRAGAADAVELHGVQLAAVMDFTARRKLREPLQHLTGRSFFRTLTLAVGPGVFVPRRETEFVAELAIRAIREREMIAPRVVDLCMGAGAIALSIAVEVPDSEVWGVELYREAFDWAAKNFEAIAPHHAHPVHGDIADALPELDGTIDVVAGNPPWLPPDIPPATPEVALWDPPQISWEGGGPDGMRVPRAFSKSGLRLLRPDGVLVMEHGVSQGPRMAQMLRDDGWLDVHTHTDPRGKQRVTTARRP
ncbi:MAG TPA: HemK/PrmC family methyltransferase [Microbacteriaceae bacterium]|nr:HemK/PrmC family methyltransferase [Microbacteriaceae bacterium]